MTFAAGAKLLFACIFGQTRMVANVKLAETFLSISRMPTLQILVI